MIVALTHSPWRRRGRTFQKWAVPWAIATKSNPDASAITWPPPSSFTLLISQLRILVSLFFSQIVTIKDDYIIIIKLKILLATFDVWFPLIMILRMSALALIFLTPNWRENWQKSEFVDHRDKWISLGAELFVSSMNYLRLIVDVV